LENDDNPLIKGGKIAMSEDVEDCRELVRGLLADPACKEVLPANVEVYPNRMFVHPNGGEKIGILVIGRSRTSRDYALNQDGLFYVANADQTGRITGYVGLRDGDEIVAAAPVREVVAGVERTPPNKGEFGPYWWVDKEFKLARNGRRVADPDEAF
jgi:hypothetical protein